MGIVSEWYSKGIGIASNESGGTGMTDWQRADLLRNMLLGFTYTDVDQIYDPGTTVLKLLQLSIVEGQSLTILVMALELHGVPLVLVPLIFLIYQTEVKTLL